MTVLAVYPEQGAATPQLYKDPNQIRSQLLNLGVIFEQWQASQPLTTESSQEQVITAYQAEVDRLMAKYSFQSVDVISLAPDHPEREALRNKFLAEHTHSDFEVRFFVEGRGLFYMHANEQVFGLMCEAGDLISVPDNVPHWFDMGETPGFKCIRLFTTPEGWVADYTDSPIAASFPSFERFVGQYL